MKKIFSKMILSVLIIISGMMTFTGCNMTNPESLDPVAGVVASRDIIEEQHWRFFKEPGQKGAIALEIFLNKNIETGLYDIATNPFGVNLDNLAASGLDNQLRSMYSFRTSSDYPQLFLFRDRGRKGGLNNVIYVNTYQAEIPEYWCSSILPLVSQNSRITKTIKLLYQNTLCKVNADNSIRPNGYMNTLETQFTLQYLDADNKFFSLRSLFNNNFICADWDIDNLYTPLYANRSIAEPRQWEIFQITARRVMPNGVFVKFLALTNTDPVSCYYVSNPGDYPLATWTHYSPSEFKFEYNDY